MQNKGGPFRWVALFLLALLYPITVCLEHQGSSEDSSLMRRTATMKQRWQQYQG
jgi:hypothetical protein